MERESLTRGASLLLLLLVACSEPKLDATALGTIRCSVRVDSVASSQPTLIIDKNVEHCGSELHNPIIGTEGTEVSNAVVSVDWPGESPERPARHLELKSAGCLFEPRVQVGQAGDVLVLGSGDDITHNPHGWLDGDITVFNFTVLDSTFSFKRALAQAGQYRVDCDTHKWMRAHVHVFDHPFAGVTGPEGAVEILAPAGARTIRVWHEMLGTQTVPVTVAAGQTVDVSVTFALADRRDRTLVPPNESAWSP